MLWYFGNTFHNKYYFAFLALFILYNIFHLELYKSHLRSLFLFMLVTWGPDKLPPLSLHYADYSLCIQKQKPQPFQCHWYQIMITGKVMSRGAKLLIQPTLQCQSSTVNCFSFKRCSKEIRFWNYGVVFYFVENSSSVDYQVA